MLKLFIGIGKQYKTDKNVMYQTKKFVTKKSYFYFS